MSNLTKTAIAQSLKTLLVGTTLDKITVQDIVTNCNLTRQTFYYHFQDVYQVLEYIFEMEVNTIVGNKLSYESWESSLNGTFQYVLDNKKFISNCYKSLGRESLERYLIKVQEYFLHQVIGKSTKSRISNPDFFCRFFAYGFIGLILDWVDDGMRENPEEITKKLSILLKELS